MATAAAIGLVASPILTAPALAALTADPGGPYQGTVDHKVEFDGSGSTEGDEHIDEYFWNFGDGETKNGKTVDHTYDTPGLYVVTLTVIDHDDNTASASTTANILPNQPPVSDPGGPYFGHVRKKVAFDGSASTDVDGKVEKYFWDFGDGETKEDKTPDHEYQSPGIYRVTLRVLDDDGASTAATTTATITDPNQPPTVKITTPVAGEVVDGTVRITASAAADASYVIFLVDGVELRTDNWGFDGWSANWDTTTLANGSHLISAVAGNRDGTGPPNAVTVTVQNKPATTTTTVPTTTTTQPTTTTTTTQPTTTTTTTQPTTTTTSSTTATTTTQPTTSGTTTTQVAPAASTEGTSTTLDVLSARVEAAPVAAMGISAAAFSINPMTWTPGHEIAITFELNATTPGIATVLFLLDGSQLGDPAATNTGAAATFTRVLPADLSVGSHRIELVAADNPSQPLASRTVGVAATGAGTVSLPQPNPPETAGNNRSVVPALIGAAAILGLATLAWHNRRRWIPRRSL